ncbi:Glycosyltransferase [Rhynchospora pubera]|uniref:Glycosyltransferase n=1 Tax=Rhynchospora pubera TaxID=906938 RepID=A0AAV8C615_9POAL|nr:Glycosyltransferase [Rhynchospora pubera]
MAPTKTVQPPFHIAAIAYPGRGHINAMMNFCCLLANRGGFNISFVVTEEWRSILSSDPPPPSCMQLRTIPNCIPSEQGRAADMNGFMEAVQTKMEEPFEHLITEQLELPVQAIVSDTYLPWVVAVGNRRGIPVCSLFPMAASFFRALNNYNLLPVVVAADGDVPTADAIAEFNDHQLEQYIPGLHPLRSSDLNTVHAVKPLKKILQSFPWLKKAQCLLFTSFYELESVTIDSIKAQVPCPVYPIGPCIPYYRFNDKTNTDKDHYLTWLDKQPKKSVLYISLGSFLSVSQAQLDELASGLVASQVKFLWVAREKSCRIQEIVGKSGLIVPWCEQLKVLCHPSIGGFLTHCGWNSTLEAVYAGVPMMTFPIFWDQDVDSRLLVEKWKVGMSLKSKIGKDGIVGKEEIAQVVKAFMDLDGDESKEFRKEALKLKEAARKARDILFFSQERRRVSKTAKQPLSQSNHTYKGKLDNSSITYN